MAWTWCGLRARSITCQVIRGETMKSWPKIDSALADYVDANWLRESPLKRRLREETAKLPQAGMQISAHQGQQIAWLAHAIGDVSEQWTGIARSYWKEAGVESRIELTIAPALKTLDRLLAQGLAGQLDLAFIDANKDGYDAYYERCLELVRPGGIVLIDNVLWGGSVANLADKDADTQAIRALNAKLKTDERVDLALFAVGDGMTCALKR